MQAIMLYAHIYKLFKEQKEKKMYILHRTLALPFTLSHSTMSWLVFPILVALHKDGRLSEG